MNRSFVIGAVAATVLAFFPAPGEAQDFQFRKVAVSGDPVPGVPGAHFTWFGVAPFTTDGFPRIDRQGNIAFAAGWTNQADPNGVFREVGGVLDKIAVAGDEAPGVGTDFLGFPNFIPACPELSEGLTSFTATITAQQPEAGVWDDRSGSLELVLRQMQQPPGAPEGSTFFQWVQVLRGGRNIVVNARYAQGGSSEINDHGFWRDRTGELELVALARTQAPGMPPGVQFGNGEAIALPAFESWDLDEEGRIAFHARLMGTGIGESNDEGIWLEGQGGLLPFVLEGDPAPGTGNPNSRFLGNFGFRTFDHDDVTGIDMNEAHHLAFGARVTIPGTDVAATLYTNRGDFLELVALARFPGEDPPGDPAPGFPTGSTFTRFLDARINNPDEVFFSAVVDTGGGFFEQDTGIWMDRAGEPELVVRPGQAVPDLAPGTVFGFSDMVNLLDSGHLIFFSQISGPMGNREGVFAMDPDGSIHTVVHTGQLFTIAPGDQRTVTGITTGAGFGPDVAFVMDLRFGGGAEGIFEARRADPAGTPAQDVAAADGPAIRFLNSRGTIGSDGSAAVLQYEVKAPSTLSLRIYDVSGQSVATLLNRRLVAAGTHSIPWDGTADSGGRLGAGVYFARLAGGREVAVRKLVLLP